MPVVVGGVLQNQRGMAYEAENESYIVVFPHATPRRVWFTSVGVRFL